MKIRNFGVFGGPELLVNLPNSSAELFRPTFAERSAEQFGSVVHYNCLIIIKIDYQCTSNIIPLINFKMASIILKCLAFLLQINTEASFPI